MKQTKYTVSIALLFALCFFIACEEDGTDLPIEEEDEELVIEGELTLLCYNVAGLPEPLSSSKPATYTSHISPLLNDYNIVHVQEDFCYHDSLVLYNEHAHTTPPSPCVPDGDGLNTFSDFPIQNFERIPWNDCHGADCFTPKGFSYSQIVLHDSLSIDFYNIHCNAGGSTEDLTARRGNIIQLAEYINTHSIGTAVILMGDFNCRYTRAGDTIRTLLDMGFQDIWVEEIRDGAIPDYGSSLKDCSLSQTAFNCETVDKLLYRSSENITLTPTFHQRGDNLDFHYNQIDSLPLSDHAPLFSNIQYRKVIGE